MKTKHFFLVIACILINVTAIAQFYPKYQWTLLEQNLMDEIIGEASGETAFNHIQEMGAYNRNRPTEEFASTLWEAEYVYNKLVEYGLEGAQIERFESGSQRWDGIRGELWEINPGRKKLADYDDITAMLASGSQNTDVEAELIWVEEGRANDFEGLDVTGKIVVTSGSPGGVHGIAIKNGAVGVISFNSPRPLVDPLQIPWSGIYSRNRNSEESKNTFAFFLPAREGHILRDRLIRGEKIKVHALVEAQNVDLDLQVPTCVIPGTDPDAGEIIFSAHLFEGYTKQGANDNISGSASILEVARMLKTMIDEGRLPQPKRGIRFIWVPEFSGTIPWVKEHKDLMKNTLCNINLDMVGLWLSKSQSFFNLERTTYGNAHYINDVLENYFRYVGETNRSSLVLSGRGGFRNRIVAPSGSDEPFYYAIEHHYGASDHEVFNDWGVGVPGVMLITWPDHYYHTSEDRPNKCDPTQMKRCSVISAAAAYTIAVADDDMIRKMAGEIFANSSRRIGQQSARALDELSYANADNLPDVYKKCRSYIEAAGLTDAETLETLIELAPGNQKIQKYLSDKSSLIKAIAENQATGLDQLMISMAIDLGTDEVSLKPSRLEKKAMSIVPNETPLVKANGYREYGSALSSVSREESMRFSRGLGSTSELQRLCKGKHNALEIKKLLDAQYSRVSDLETILDYLKVLKESGL
ncbi:MAG: M28 family peptidase, partial [Bacteroidetes bacterium]|nr:M28 family peptidase [Bacteroidota bacterium]